MVNVGVIGYSEQSFNEQKARNIIRKTYEELENKYNNICIVSGYTNLGIPKIAYEEACEKDLKTVGIACEKAKNYETFPVDEYIIDGEEWGDESETFLNYIDIIIKIGGGKQSNKEIKKAKQKNISVYKIVNNI